jgi:predicted dehydrogenase
LSLLYDVVGLAEPSRTVREHLATRYAIPNSLSTSDELLEATDLDAVIVCSPTATHGSVVKRALAHGLHVFVEKPLCMTLQDADDIVRAAAADGLVVQVGYMKRFDQAYERLLHDLPESADDLRFIDVVTYDPGLAAFFPPGALVQADDVQAEVRTALHRSELEQTLAAVGSTAPADVWGFGTTFLAALVHDVNLVHGILSAMGVHEAPHVVGAACWAEGQAGTTLARVASNAIWSNTWVQLPAIGDFRERITLYYADSVMELLFAAPYSELKQLPTQYQARGPIPGGTCTTSYLSRDISFESELRHFYECVTAGVKCRNPPGDARRDIEFLTRAFRAARQHGVKTLPHEVPPPHTPVDVADATRR